MQTNMSGVNEIGKEPGMKAALARHLGISPAAVSKWDRIPAERVVEVESFTGIPRERLRPDLYRRVSYPQKSSR